ncbi:acyltransferase [Janthinobacterium sp. GW458P]|uniref:acyltransferase family protein n=1 Tax=Janthinobacterium sp. GW458P TaxID=1981504 RepID=UPI000A320BD2|nr:acyltransferase [Janthinobacterium sp. GW458P]MBE3028135.1 acyltransferase [Janthinobacterium sp. GW458P]
MDVVSFLPAVASLLLALLCCALIVRRWGAPPLAGRYGAIDGLRGYLAFFVFLHHGCIWYFYLRYGAWNVPPSPLYTNFGHASVAMFFMITGFLFYAKLLAARSRGVDWGKLYISRIFRLTPLYLFAMVLLFITVACLSGFRIQETLPKLLTHTAQWLMFTAVEAPDLNGIKNTTHIMAGVTWSLPYEWLFYLLLPLLALPLRITPPWPYLLASAVVFVSVLTAAIILRAPVHHFFAFLAGMIAAVLVLSPAFCRFCQSRLASIFTLACIATACLAFPSAHEIGSLLLLSIAFAMIAGGTSIFGILHTAVSRTFGEFAYSIYLLHGLLLFVTFHFVIGRERAMTFSPFLHWSVILLLTPLLVCICFMTFKLIEQPGMRHVNAAAAYFRRASSQAKSSA